MPIKDKDGNIYKLRRPNPVMKEQEFWDKSKLKLINFQFKDEKVADKGTVSIREIINPIGEPKQKKEVENILDLTPEPKIEPQLLPEPIEIPEPVQKFKEIPKETIQPPIPVNDRSRTSGEQPSIYNVEQKAEIQRKKITIYCLPIFDREIKDDIYGETYKIKSYGDKFTFEGVMVEEEDLYCRFWTNTQIPENSIVYPKNHSRRWWQVQSLQSVDDGFMIECAPTHANPDFTD